MNDISTTPTTAIRHVPLIPVIERLFAQSIYSFPAMHFQSRAIPPRAAVQTGPAAAGQSEVATGAEEDKV
jgi:hypothetical protein